MADDLMTEDTLTGVQSDQWGIFLNGAPVITPDTFLSFGFSVHFSIADYPLQQGAFESFNKVRQPFENKLTVATGGSLADRQELLSAVDAISGDLNSYDMATPEKIYNNCNVTHYGYDKSAMKGNGLLAIEIWFSQVRIEAQAGFSDTQQPEGSSPQNGGNVQPTTPTAIENTQFTGIT